jgi:hypothetical protein
MQRIQYHRYSGSEKCVWRHMNSPPSANMFMVRARFPRAVEVSGGGQGELTI